MSKATPLQKFLEDSTPIDLAKVLLSLAEGCNIIARLVNNAGLSNILGTTGDTNVQGETVQKLDDLSNKILMDYLRASETCAGYLSEENEGVTTLNETGKYVISVDPLDGSSNIDICAPIGTIFNIMQRISVNGQIEESDFYQKGIYTKAAGYVIYGSSTIFVLSTGAGVHGFTLNTDDHQFYLSHPNMTMPAQGKIYSLNQGNIEKFSDGVKNFVTYCSTTDKATARPFSLRYIGSMVGDMHRTFIKGGIFIYPANKGEKTGKLRVLYECIPMSFLAEQAGGRASNGYQRILDIVPMQLHERTAIFIGSQDLVSKAQAFLSGEVL